MKFGKEWEKKQVILRIRNSRNTSGLIETVGADYIVLSTESGKEMISKGIIVSMMETKKEGQK